MTKMNRTLKTILLILIIPLVAEVFFFNFRFWESLFFKDVTTYSTGNSANEIVLGNMDAPVRNIHVDVSGATDEKTVHTRSSKICTSIHRLHASAKQNRHIFCSSCSIHFF